MTIVMSVNLLYLQRMADVEKAILGQQSSGPLLQRLHVLEESVFGEHKNGALALRVRDVLAAAAAFL